MKDSSFIFWVGVTLLSFWLGTAVGRHYADLAHYRTEKVEKAYADSLTVAWQDCAMGRPQRIYFNREDYVEVACKPTNSNLWKGK